MKSASIIIPDKFYFKIGEVAELLDLPTHVLRFWESEFKRIKPKRTSAGQRLYRKKDVDPNAPEAKQAQKNAGAASKNAKQTMRMIRRIGRF